MSAKKINVVDKAHTITPNFRQVDVMGGWTAAAGATFIYSPQLPERLQGKAMVCEPTMKTISLMDVQPTGAGYVAKDGFNLVASSDEWMSPVFAEVGPDGAVRRQRDVEGVQAQGRRVRVAAELHQQRQADRAHLAARVERPDQPRREPQHGDLLRLGHAGARRSARARQRGCDRSHAASR